MLQTSLENASVCVCTYCNVIGKFVPRSDQNLKKNSFRDVLICTSGIQIK